MVGWLQLKFIENGSGVGRYGLRGWILERDPFRGGYAGL